MTQADALTQRVLVTDTHSLWYYFTQPELLSDAATRAFSSAEAGDARIVVPAIVVAELYYLSVKVRAEMSPARIVQRIASERGLELRELGQEQLELLSALTDIPEMHDRLIAAEAVLLDAPVITRDGEILAAAGVEYVW